MSDDITTLGGKAIVWHLRQGHDNAKLDRDALALWIEAVTAENTALKKALETIEAWPFNIMGDCVADARRVAHEALELK